MKASRRFFGKILASAPLAAAVRQSPGDLARQPSTPVSGYSFDSCSNVPTADPDYHRRMIRKLERQAQGFDDDPESMLETRSHSRVSALADHYGSFVSLPPSSRSRLLREAMAESARQTWMERAKLRLADLLKT